MTRNGSRWLPLIPLLLVCSTLTASAAIVHVPEDASTIQGGIELAVDGDTVLVASEIYWERIDFLGKEITVISASGPDFTWIDGGDVGTVVTMTDIGGSGCRLEGFTITGGTGTALSGILCGGGVLVDRSTATLANNVIRNNLLHGEYGEWWSAHGAGVCLLDSSVTLTGNTIRENAASGSDYYGWPLLAPHPDRQRLSGMAAQGGGIYFEQCQVTMSANVVEDNTCSGGDLVYYAAYEDSQGGLAWGGGLYGEIGTLSSKNDQFLGNTVHGGSAETATVYPSEYARGGYGRGGGIFLSEVTASITGAIINGNRAYGGDALALYDYCIYGYAEGGGIYTRTAGVTIDQCQFLDNSLVGGTWWDNDRGGPGNTLQAAPRSNGCVHGAGLLIKSSTPSSVINCFFAGGSVEQGYLSGSALYLEGQHNVLHSTVVWNGTAEAVYGPESLLKNCIVYHNDLGAGSFLAEYCDVEGGHAGPGNFDEDPGFSVLDDPHLDRFSPCVDAGEEAGVTVDIDGQSRPAGAGFDVGADEYWATGLTETATPSSTPTPSPSQTGTCTAVPTGTPDPSSTSSPSVTPTAPLTPTRTPTGHPSRTSSPTPTDSATPTAVGLALVMPAQGFGEGDSCSLMLFTSNEGAAREVDLYAVLDVYGAYWCYPSWQPLDAGLDHQALTVPTGDSIRTLIPDFTMPAVSPCGPLYFYAAMFEQGTLDLGHLASNGAVYEFYLD